MARQRQRDIVRSHDGQETDEQAAGEEKPQEEPQADKSSNDEKDDSPELIDRQMAKALEYLKQKLSAEDKKTESAKDESA
jgi:hypothetical protein